jgi:putative intracellular protease/amidase
MRCARCIAAGRWVCAVCAAPLVLQAAGILSGRRVTCFPGWPINSPRPHAANARVVVEDKLITSQGAGTSLEFALAIVRRWAAMNWPTGGQRNGGVLRMLLNRAKNDKKTLVLR